MVVGRGNASIGNPDDDHIVDEEILQGRVRPSPRYGRFLAVGIVLGLIAAVVLTLLSGANEAAGGPISTGAAGILRVFGVYAAVCVGAGLAIFGLLALVLDVVTSKHSRSVRVEHATSLTVDLDEPANDDVPLWVRDSDDLA